MTTTTTTTTIPSSALRLFLLLALTITITTIHAIPDFDCPAWLKSSGIANDMASLSFAVSVDPMAPQSFQCGRYLPKHEVNGYYDTRMRIYTSERTNDTFIVFRFTVQPNGEIIHINRTMAPCIFLGQGCTGQVHGKFQAGFNSMIASVSDWSPYLDNKKVYVMGTSLGGALQLFMGLWLWKVKEVVPEMSLGIAGPFIGNKAFNDAYQEPFRQVMNGTWWQSESVDIKNATRYDDVCESYQVPPTGRELYVNRQVMCAMPVKALKVPEEAFGMHDLRNYHLFLSGTDCSL